MNNKKLYEFQANICKALANPLRIEIINLLNGGEMSFGDIQRQLDISKSNLSQHLSVMITNGLLEQRKEGTNSYFKLASGKVAFACQIMREMLQENLNEKIKTFSLIDN